MSKSDCPKVEPSAAVAAPFEYPDSFTNLTTSELVDPCGINCLMCTGRVGSNLYPGTLSAGITSPVKSAPTVMSALTSKDADLEFPFTRFSIAPSLIDLTKPPLKVRFSLAFASNCFLLATSISSNLSLNLLARLEISLFSISSALPVALSSACP